MDLNEELNDDLNINNNIKRGKGRPYGVVGPYKPRLPKALKNNNTIELNEINLINPESQINAEINLQVDEDILPPEPLKEVQKPETQEHELINLENLDLNDLKNNTYEFKLPQTSKKPQLKPITPKNNAI